MATTRPRLGELLLLSRVCTREQLREAWEQKVLYGDRLGTNLLALGHIDEEHLAAALGQQLGVHSGFGRVIAPDEAVLAKVPKSLAVKRFVVPHHAVDKQLFLLMRDPLDAVAVDEVAFATGLKVTPVVVCEARIWQLLEKHYRAVASLRPVPLDGVRPQPRPSVDDPSATVPLGPELTSEEEFEQLYAGIHQPAERSQDFEPPPITPLPAGGGGDDFVERTTPARPVALQESVLAPPRAGGDHQGWREALENTQPMLALPRATAEQSEQGEPEAIIELVEVVDPLARQPTLDFHVDVQDIVDESPLSFQDASRVLLAATDRNAIARTVLRAARTRFSRACLLAVYPDRFVGWMGLGEGMETERLRDVVMPRADKSVFSLVADSRSHYLGPLARLPAHGRWVKATGRKIPKSLAVFPILVRGRPVNLLVVDNGHDQFVGSDVGEVLILAQQIAKTYETLLTSSSPSA